ncbi:MarR family transcriptional regulator [Xylophilus sp. Kf1]|nr:MarR family transcriptional regulator [Xylophilus sp. Kf1]
MPTQQDAKKLRELVLAVFSTSGCLTDAGTEIVRPVGLTTAWWQVLGALGYSPVPLPVAHIARNMGLTRQSVQRVVELLADQHFVSFESNPHHARARLVVLTPSGRAALDAAEAVVAPLDRKLIERIGADRLGVAIAVLDELRHELPLALAALRADSPPAPPHPERNQP